MDEASDAPLQLIQCHSPELSSVRGRLNSEEVRRYFAEYRRQKEIASRFDDEYQSQDCNIGDDCDTDNIVAESADSETEVKRELPDHIKMVIEVINCSVTFCCWNCFLTDMLTVIVKLANDISTYKIRLMFSK